MEIFINFNLYTILLMYNKKNVLYKAKHMKNNKHNNNNKFCQALYGGLCA